MELTRWLAVGAIVGALAVGVAAQGIKPAPAKQVDTFSGVMELTTGYVRRSDGTYHPGEDAFLVVVAQAFGLDDRCFTIVRSRASM